MNRLDILEREEDILQWIKEELPKCEMCKKLNCKAETLNIYLKKMGIEYKGQQAKKGQLKGTNYYTSIEDYLHNCKSIKSYQYKLKLIKFGIKKEECEMCHNTTWNGKQIPLELHHIDGNHFNNDLSNVMILCPNCHAQQENNSGKGTLAYKNKRATNFTPENDLALKNKRERVYDDEKTIELKNEGRVDSIGRVSEYILTEEEWEDRKNKILASNVDLSKYGWKVKVANVSGLTRRQVDNTIEHFYEFFKDLVYIRGK